MAIQSTYGTWDSFTWPYPRVIYNGQQYIGMAYGGTDLYLFEMTVESNNWNATRIKDLGAAANIVSVDVAGFGLFYVVVVGTSSGNLMYKKDTEVSVGTNSLVSVSKGSYPIGSTVCNFKGQLIVGGLESQSDIWEGLGKCSVAWSGIGSLEFDPISDSTAGFKTMPWDRNKNGRVYAVRRLGDYVAVYGDSGRALLKPISVKNVSGFGLKELTGTGIPYQTCVGGDVNSHCFIDRNHDMWIMTGNLEARRLGYREWVDDLFASDDDIVISYSAKNKKFYISDGNLCFVLSEFGLYSANQCPTCVFDYDGVLSGLFDDTADYETRTTLSQTDFGVRGLKTLETIDFFTNHDHSSGIMQGRVDARYNHNSDFRDGDWVRLNDVGMITPIMTGNDFKIKFKGPDYRTTTELTLDDIKARFKIVDRRGLRGMY